MNTLVTQRSTPKRKTQQTQLCLLLSMVILLSLLLFGGAVLLQRTLHPSSTSGQLTTLSLSSAKQTSTSAVSVTHVDSRPCVRAPSSTTCNGVAPVAPGGFAVQEAVNSGVGACIDGASRLLETQTLTDASNAAIGTLELHYVPRCDSYYAFLSFTIPAQQITSVSVWVQTERYGWYEKLSLLPPYPLQKEQTGPFQAHAITTQDFYSPLIYSSSDPVSAQANVTLTDGTLEAPFTSSYTAGVQQYSGVA